MKFVKILVVLNILGISMSAYGLAVDEKLLSKFSGMSPLVLIVSLLIVYCVRAFAEKLEHFPK